MKTKHQNLKISGKEAAFLFEVGFSVATLPILHQNAVDSFPDSRQQPLYVSVANRLLNLEERTRIPEIGGKAQQRFASLWKELILIVQARLNWLGSLEHHNIYEGFQTRARESSPEEEEENALFNAWKKWYSEWPPNVELTTSCHKVRSTLIPVLHKESQECFELGWKFGLFIRAHIFGVCFQETLDFPASIVCLQHSLNVLPESVQNHVREILDWAHNKFRRGKLGLRDLDDFWPMVVLVADTLVKEHPASIDGQDEKLTICSTWVKPGTVPYRILLTLKKAKAFSFACGLTQEQVRSGAGIKTQGGLDKAWSKLRTAINTPAKKEFIPRVGAKKIYFTNGPFILT